ncbi:hypothetical protein PYCCODRAFT_1439649 [Trametes coccinea BRFM310]|uniref:F-box domain-containing protein n=1 Tax=Trametes coccinea (strain BRFM310) TaxID=1353009 RepID=A0A1Y2IA18_TRAC3|nr:hypothetical protein PYCCODRAFT_1439649 [Trametes coccinea BRFM310]
MQPHRALSVPDIINDVFRYFDLDHWKHAAFVRDPSATENTRLRSLAASARVCTVFRDAALPVLWGSLGNAVPLVRLLSACIKEPLKNAANGKEYPGIYVFRIEAARVPSQEMERLKYYGSLVRKLDLNAMASRYCERGPNVYSYTVDPSSWAYLQALFDGDGPGLLLPNLRYCALDFGHLSELSLLRLGASPSLSTINLHYPSVRRVSPELREEWQSTIEQLLSDVLPLATQLESFKLTCRGLQLSPRMAASIARAPSLRSLELLFFFSSDVPVGINTLWTALPIISPLEQLQRLVLFHDLSTESPGTPSVTSSTGSILPQLQELEVFGAQNALHLRPLLQLVQSTTLQRFNLKGLQYRDVSTLREICDTIAKCFPSLPSFSCHISGPSETGTDLTMIAPLRKAIAPLLASIPLTSLKIVTSRVPYLTLTDDDLAAISASWPRLRILALTGFDPKFTSKGPARITVASLVKLATGCPELQRLELPSLDVRASHLAPVESYPLLDHRLEFLSAWEYVRDERETAAPIINRLFPHLKVNPLH